METHTRVSCWNLYCWRGAGLPSRLGLPLGWTRLPTSRTGKIGLVAPPRPDYVSSSHRRPADVFLPSFLGHPTALDFAITAPQRLDVLGARGSESAAVAYSEHKRRHLGTSAACAASKSPFSQCGDDRGLSPWGWEGLAQISRAVTFAGHAVPGATTLLQQACRLAAQGWGDRRLVCHFPLSCMWVGPCCFL